MDKAKHKRTMFKESIIVSRKYSNISAPLESGGREAVRLVTHHKNNACWVTSQVPQRPLDLQAALTVSF